MERQPQTESTTPITCAQCGAAGLIEVTHCEWCGAEYPVPDGARPAPQPPLSATHPAQES